MTRRHVEQLWLRFRSFYGLSTLEASIGRTDDGTWLAGLQDMTPEDLGRGLRALLDEPEPRAFPPSLPQFRALCRDKSEPGRTRLGTDAGPMLADLREWKRTEAGEQGLADALALAGVRRKQRP